MAVTSFNESIEKSRQYEFKALCKIISDMGVELRLLAALAEQSERDKLFTGEDIQPHKVDAAKIVEIANRYEDKFLDVMRETIHKLNSIK